MEIDYKRGIINLEYLKHKQLNLVKTFMAIVPEDKIVVFDKEASIIFNDIISPAQFKKYNVKGMYYTDDIPRYKNKSYLYFVLPTHESIFFMNRNRNFFTNGENKHTICFVGKRDMKVENNLHHNYIWDYVTVYELDITMVCAEYDCINLNINKSIHKLFVDEDIKTFRHILHCMETIQRLYGKIPEIVSHGKISDKIRDMLHVDNKINGYLIPNISISKLVLIDRLVDTVTPCLTQLTYEGAIDDIIGITNKQIYIGNKYVPMNSGCPYYQDVRDKSLNVSNTLLESHANSCFLNLKYYGTNCDEDTLKFLSDVAKKNMEISGYLKKHVDIRAILGKTISGAFWNKLVEIEHLILTVQEPDGLLDSLLDDRIENTEMAVIDFIDTSIGEKQPLYDILGCLSLYFQIYGRNMDHNGYSRLIGMLCDKYPGCYQIVNHMEKLGLMAKKKFSPDGLSLTSFKQTIKKLALLKKVDIECPDPTDLCCICAGYAPITSRIIEAEKKSLLNPDDLMMVLFVGGCNYSEISACRLIGNTIVTTTEIFNREKFFNSI